jgi:hypothetical protein
MYGRKNEEDEKMKIMVLPIVEDIQLDIMQHKPICEKRAKRLQKQRKSLLMEKIS